MVKRHIIAGMMIVTMFTKSNCSLCEDVRVVLDGLGKQFPLQLREVDITADEALFATYRYRIPVVQFGGVEMSAPIDAEKLRKALQDELAFH